MLVVKGFADLAGRFCRGLGIDRAECLGALGLFNEAGTSSGRIARAWLWRQGRGTCGFLLFGSPQRCTSNGGAQSN